MLSGRVSNVECRAHAVVPSSLHPFIPSRPRSSFRLSPFQAFPLSQPPWGALPRLSLPPPNPNPTQSGGEGTTAIPQYRNEFPSLDASQPSPYVNPLCGPQAPREELPHCRSAAVTQNPEPTPPRLASCVDLFCVLCSVHLFTPGNFRRAHGTAARSGSHLHKSQCALRVRAQRHIYTSIYLHSGSATLWNERHWRSMIPPQQRERPSKSLLWGDT